MISSSRRNFDRASSQPRLSPLTATRPLTARIHSKTLRSARGSRKCKTKEAHKYTSQILVIKKDFQQPVSIMKIATIVSIFVVGLASESFASVSELGPACEFET
jgi:hypothetical protein